MKYILLILLFSSIKSQPSGQKNPDPIGVILKIFEGLEVKCFPEIDRIFTEKQKLEKDKKYPWILDAIGKSLNDIGDEIECMKTINNSLFIMLNFYNLPSATLIKPTDDYLSKFLEIDNYCIGLCIMDECKETIIRYAKIVTRLINVISTNKTKQIRSSYILNDKFDNSSEFNVRINKEIEYNDYKRNILIIIGVFAGLKFIGGILRVIFIPKGYNKYLAQKMNKSKINDKVSDKEERNSITKKRKFNKNLDDESNEDTYNPLFDYTDKLPIYIKFLKFFDIWDDLYFLSSKRNKYFNDNGLDVINFNRTIVIFFLVFSHTFSALISIPTEEIMNATFFKDYKNIFYRLSNNSFTCWIFLEGAHTTYKLICFVTSEMFRYYAESENNKSCFFPKLLLIYGKFLLLMIPKCIEFFSVYYILYYDVEQFGKLFTTKATFNHIITHIFKKDIECRSFTSLFNFSFSFNFQDYTKCYEFIYFYINMFLCIFASLIIISLFFLIKHPIFETIIMLLNFVFLFVSIVLVEDSKNQIDQPFLQYHIVGQTYTTKMFLPFLVCYNFGLITGLLLFNFNGTKNLINKLIYENHSHYFSNNNNVLLYKETISSENTDENGRFDSIDNGKNNDNEMIARNLSFSSSISYTNFQLPYYPLLFLNKILMWLKKKNITVKILLILLCLVIFCLVDLPLLIFLNLKEDFDIKLNIYMKYFFMFEKNVFIIFYFLLIIIMITLPKNGTIRSIMQSRIVIFISRIGFILTCVVYALTFFSFRIVNLRVKLYVPTFAIISFGNFLFISLGSFIVCSLIELPLSILVKQLLRIGKNKEKAAL